jgi:hypothetical protein
MGVSPKNAESLFSHFPNPGFVVREGLSLSVLLQVNAGVVIEQECKCKYFLYEDFVV